MGIGEILWDIFPDYKKLGGAPANFVYHVSQLGGNGMVVSARGKDILGEEIQSALKKKSLDCYLQEVDYPSGTVQVKLDENKEPAYLITENVAWDHIALTSELQEMAGCAHAVSFGTLAQRCKLSGNTIRQVLRLLPAGALKIFDINLRQHFYTSTGIRESLELANILKINESELEVITPLFGLETLRTEEKCRKLVHDFQLKVLILTCGSKGSSVYTPTEESYLETPRIKLADPVGAGDSFTAGFAMGMLRNKGIAAAHKLAVDLSAYVCTQEGAMPLLPSEFIERLGN